MNQKNRNKLTYRLAFSGVLIALGVTLSTFYIPVGVSKCFPVQHLINIIGAVVLGPQYALLNAFVISVIRNMTGLGSLLAFPGSMIGALLAGYAYKLSGNHRLAALGEIIGTGLIGGTVATPFAALLMGKETALFFFLMPFIISSLAGTVMALILFETTSLVKIALKDRVS